MNFLTEKPAIAEILNCIEHGEYEVNYLNLGQRFAVFDSCPSCVKEKNLREKSRKINDRKSQFECNKAIEQKEKRIEAGISERNLFKTFNDWNAKSEMQKKAKSSCMNFVNSLPHCKNLLLIGGVGTGKTQMAEAMVDFLINDRSCKISTITEILRNIKSTWNKTSKKTEAEVIKYYRNLDLLIIDEVGLQFGSDAEKLIIFEVIDGRYKDMKPTILISNFDKDRLENIIGSRCIDRLRQGGNAVSFDWPSLRKED